MVERIRNLIESRQLTPTQFADSIGVARPIISHILSGRNKPSLDVVQRILAAMPELSISWLLNGTGPMEPEAPQMTPAAADSGPEPAIASASGTTASVETAPLAWAPGHLAIPAEKSTATASNSRVNPSKSASIPAFKRFTASSNEAGKPLAPPRTAPVSNEVESPLALEAINRIASPVPAAVLTTQAEGEMPVQASPDVASPAPEVLSSATRQMLPSPVTDEPSVAKPSAGPDSGSQHLASRLLTASGKAIRRIVIFYHDGSFADYQPE